jgi:RNA polymerase sigma factor (sigma-70 family)
MESFEQIAEQYHSMIHKIIHTLHIYKNVDDFYQTGLIALWDAQKYYNDEKGNFTSFAYTWIKGCILHEMAKNNKLSERYVYPDQEYWELITDKSDVLPFEEEFLLTYGKTLNEKETNWLIKACFTGLSIKEIAESEGVSESAVKQRRMSARKKLLKQIKTID